MPARTARWKRTPGRSDDLQGGGADILDQRPKARTTGADDFYNVQQVAKGAGKAIIVAHDDHVAATKLIKQPVQRWPLPGCAGQRI